MECIVGEDFDMECGICLEGGEYFFSGWILEGTIGDSLRGLPVPAPGLEPGPPAWGIAQGLVK